MDSHVSFATKASVKGAATFDVDRFTNTHSISNKATPNPDKQVLKLLKKLLKIYMGYFDPKIFCESKQSVRDEQKQNLPRMVDEMKMLRVQEHEKLGSREICFDQLLDCEESRKDKEATKRCFWTNLYNFKMLQKMLEILLSKQPKLLKKLDNCTMYVSLMISVKVLVQNEWLSCYEIFKTMLKHDDIKLMTGPMEEPVRTLD